MRIIEGIDDRLRLYDSKRVDIARVLGPRVFGTRCHVMVHTEKDGPMNEPPLQA